MSHAIPATKFLVNKEADSPMVFLDAAFIGAFLFSTLHVNGQLEITMRYLKRGARPYVFRFVFHYLLTAFASFV